ncbi:MAG TPA: rhomboid family intramembrane serine protease [Candidatus Acidoferrales bacterium]|nr:rhomboid family intramembrane serine protease [Candidatus Acidoferrales bacterium]
MPLSHRWRWKLDRWREQFAAMFHSEERQPRPKLCPSCGTLVGSTAKRCHQCGTSMTFSIAAASKSLSRILPSNAPVTYLILSSCCILYGLSLLLTIRGGHIPESSGGLLSTLLGIGGINSFVLYRLGASLPFPIDILQPWRLVTACFLHANLMHIFFNMWVLVDIAPAVEELYGSPRFLFLYVVSGIGGYLLSGFVGHFSIGASGAIVGLIGVLLAITYRRRSTGMQMLREQVWRWIIYLAIWGFMFPGVDNMAHLGGGITGFILASIMMDRAPADSTERKRAYALGWLTAVAVLASFIFMIFSRNRLLF